MEKIAAKIVECELEKCGEVAAIHLKVDYGCQQFFTISEKVNLFKFLDFFNVGQLSKVAGKYCYLMMKDYHNIIELQQFPCHGYDILTLETGEIISEFERKDKLAKQEEWKTGLDNELEKIKLQQSSPKLVRIQIIELFKKLGTGKEGKGISKSEIFEWLNLETSNKSKNVVIEQEFQKLLKEGKIIGFGNTRAKKYMNSRNYAKFTNLKIPKTKVLVVK